MDRSLLLPFRARSASDEDERRMLVGPLEVRADGDKGKVLEGYAAVFNQDTQIGGLSWGFMESIAAGAFTRTIRDDDIRALFNHDENKVLGRNKGTNESLELEEDGTGLRVTIRPPDTTDARDVVTLVERGDVDGMSFSFLTRKQEWAEPTTKGELPKRTLLDVQLFDVGPVVFPAYPQTSIKARNHVKALREAEELAVRQAAEADARAVGTAVADGDRVRRLRLMQAR